MQHLSTAMPLLDGLMKAADKNVDREIQAMSFPLSVQERQQMQVRLTLHGIGSRVVIWRQLGRYVLLMGYQVFPLLRDACIRFKPEIKEFANRDKAWLFVLKEQLAQKNLSELEVE
jgi:hypothetical protein